MEEEMGQSAELDAQHEQQLSFICEQELVLRNLLGKFLPLVKYVAANDSQQFNHILVRETATLALCRYMSISSVTCESCLPLLFTTLEREGGADGSGSVTVRNTIMIALGDLAFRFPNSIEPWTDRMYSK
jgi:condensin complex subunit 1